MDAVGGDAETSGYRAESVAGPYRVTTPDGCHCTRGAQGLARVDRVRGFEAVECGHSRPSLRPHLAQVIAGAHHIRPGRGGTAVESPVDDGHDLVVSAAEQLLALGLVAVQAVDDGGRQGVRVAGRCGGGLHRLDAGGRGLDGGFDDGAYRGVGVLRPGGGVAVEPVDVHRVTHAGYVPAGTVLPCRRESPRGNGVGNGTGVAQTVTRVPLGIARHPQAVVSRGNRRPVCDMDGAGAHVDERLGSPMGGDDVKPCLRPCDIARLFGLPVQHGDDAGADEPHAVGLAVEQRGVRLRGHGGVGEPISAQTQPGIAGCAELTVAVGIAIVVALREFDEAEPRAGVDRCVRVVAALIAGRVEPDVSVGDAREQHRHCREHGEQRSEQSARHPPVPGMTDDIGQIDLL